MNLIAKVIVLVSFYMFVGCSPRTQEIYVSPIGSSQNTGSQDSPVATIQEALDKAFDYKKANVKLKLLFTFQKANIVWVHRYN